LWHADAEKLALKAGAAHHILDEKDPDIHRQLKLEGAVNRLDAWLVAQSLGELLKRPSDDIIGILNRFPGLARRFEQITEGIYSDYAHTPPKIAGALQVAREKAGDNVVVIYEGLHNTRQHFIKDELRNLFDGVKHLYIVPSYLAREDKTLDLLTPAKILDLLSNKVRSQAEAAELNQELAGKIKSHAQSGDIVLALSAGGSGSLDEWLRDNFKTN
jgi:UDP-N-acetylmuramate-alanine ligase